jgi:hypothetical protein
LPFLPADLPAGWFGAIVFALALALLAWAIVAVVTLDRPARTAIEVTTDQIRRWLIVVTEAAAAPGRKPNAAPIRFIVITVIRTAIRPRKRRSYSRS